MQHTSAAEEASAAPGVWARARKAGRRESAATGGQHSRGTAPSMQSPSPPRCSTSA